MEKYFKDMEYTGKKIKIGGVLWKNILKIWIMKN